MPGPGSARAVAGRPRAAFAVAAGALAFTVVAHLVDFGAEDLRIRLLDAGFEWSFSHILATAAFAAGAVVGVRGARSGARHPRAWWWIAGLFGFLFADNVTRAHEHVPGWPLFYAPVLVGLLVAVAVVARGSSHDGLVRAGIALLVTSLAIHVLGPGAERVLGWGPATWGYQIKVGLKEGTELGGWVLLVPALAAIAGRRDRPAALRTRPRWVRAPASSSEPRT